MVIGNQNIDQMGQFIPVSRTIQKFSSELITTSSNRKPAKHKKKNILRILASDRYIFVKFKYVIRTSFVKKKHILKINYVKKIYL